MVDTFKKLNHIDFLYHIKERRKGEVTTSYADVSKAKKLLGFKTTKTLEDMVYDAWEFEKKHS